MEIKHVRPPLLVFGLIILIAAIVLMLKQTFSKEVPSVESPTQVSASQPFTLTSPSFEPNKAIPAVYSCGGANVNPPLRIENPPNNAKEFVLIMHDPDASNKDWVHWLVWNIPTDTSLISENSSPIGAVQGTTDFGKPGYGGPCPPKNSGTHNYIFELYALNESVSLKPETTREELSTAINGKVISKTQLVGTFESTK